VDQATSRVVVCAVRIVCATRGAWITADRRKRRGVCKSAVYHRAMGLFRTTARKKREKAAAELLKEQTRTARAQAQVARREVIAEERPNPDQPGWGRAIGQEVGKAREHRPSQE
jgi:hypothetical protein